MGCEYPKELFFYYDLSEFDCCMFCYFDILEIEFDN